MSCICPALYAEANTSASTIQEQEEVHRVAGQIPTSQHPDRQVPSLHLSPPLITTAPHTPEVGFTSMPAREERRTLGDNLTEQQKRGGT